MTTTTTTRERVIPVIKRMSFITAHGKASGDADIEMVISSDTIDRHGDVIVPAGLRREPKDLRNIPVLYGHDSSALPIGHVTHLAVDAHTIRAGVKWLRNDTFADRVRNAVEQGVLRGWSIGFQPHAYEPLKGGGLKFTDFSILELSAVPIPANPDAVRTLERLGLGGSSSCAQGNAYLSELDTQFRQGKTLSQEDAQRMQDALIVLRTLVKAESTPPPAPELAVVGDDGVVIRIAPDVLAGAITTATKHEIATALGRIPDDEPIFATRGSNEPVISLSNQELAELVREGLSASVRDALRDLTGRVD